MQYACFVFSHLQNSKHQIETPQSEKPLLASCSSTTLDSMPNVFVQYRKESSPYCKTATDSKCEMETDYEEIQVQIGGKYFTEKHVMVMSALTEEASSIDIHYLQM